MNLEQLARTQQQLDKFRQDILEAQDLDAKLEIMRQRDQFLAQLNEQRLAYIQSQHEELALLQKQQAQGRY